MLFLLSAASPPLFLLSPLKPCKQQQQQQQRQEQNQYVHINKTYLLLLH
jgi:hypothetical protein